MLSRRAGLSATAELSCFKRIFRTYSIRVLLRHDNTTPNLKAASQTLWIYDYISPTNELRMSHYSRQVRCWPSADDDKLQLWLGLWASVSSSTLHVLSVATRVV